MTNLSTISTCFDKQLLKIEHYQKHPQMIPFIGINYGKIKKILIIGESHFCPKDTDKNKINNWYNIYSSTLNSDLIDYTSTSGILVYNIKNNRFNGSHRLYKNIYDAIKETGFNIVQNGQILTFISFMNFFQRPEINTGSTIKATKTDIDIANKVLKQVIEIIKPQYIFFVSSKAYNCFDKSLFEENKTGHSCHPTCPWWNRKYGKAKITGKNYFKCFVKSNNIFNI